MLAVPLLASLKWGGYCKASEMWPPSHAIQKAVLWTGTTPRGKERPFLFHCPLAAREFASPADPFGAWKVPYQAPWARDKNGTPRLQWRPSEGVGTTRQGCLPGLGWSQSQIRLCVSRVSYQILISKLQCYIGLNYDSDLYISKQQESHHSFKSPYLMQTCSKAF